VKISASLKSKLNWSFIALPALVLGIFLGAGCSSAPTTQTEPDPVVLFKEAEEDFKHDHYQIALEKYRVVRNRFPYSSVAVDASLRMGDVLFEQELFAEAAVAYETFRDLHPKHEKTSYAMYRIAKSLLNDTPHPVSRDLTSATKAVEAYRNLLRKFPDCKEAADAKKELSEARNLLAEKELYIGDYYVRQQAYAAAKPRFEKVVQNFEDTESAKVAKDKLEQIKALEGK
jgi:outer membrane protein assembly factor BamD